MPKTKKELEELYQYHITRIRKLDPKFNPNFFKKWFMERIETVTAVFDSAMIMRCFMIWQDMQRGYDHFVVIAGGEGFGKSTLSFQMASWVNPNFKLENVCYGARKYIEILQKKARVCLNKKEEEVEKESLVMDEGTELLSKDALTKTNKVIIKTTFIQRRLKYLVIINIPNFFLLDTTIRSHRTKTLVEITKRGKYKCITGKAISLVAQYGLKNKKISSVKIPNGTFWHGDFTKHFPRNIDPEEYDVVKLVGIDETLNTLSEDLNNDKTPRKKP